VVEARIGHGGRWIVIDGGHWFMRRSQDGEMDMVQQTIVWAAFCLAALGLALWRPGAGRRALGIFFIIMAVGVNVALVLAAPDRFVDLGTSAPLLPPYEWVFQHVIARAPAVFGLLVASFEITMGLLMIMGGQWGSLGLLGGIVFLLVIAPLGPWTVPNLIMAAALGAILLRDPRLPSSLRGVSSGLQTRDGSTLV
jgi:hypothetical protein